MTSFEFTNDHEGSAGELIWNSVLPFQIVDNIRLIATADNVAPPREQPEAALEHFPQLTPGKSHYRPNANCEPQTT